VIHFFIIILLYFFLIFSAIFGAQTVGQDENHCKELFQRHESRTVMLLEVDPVTQKMIDRMGKFTPTVQGGRVSESEDKKFGTCLAFGNDSLNRIVVPDEGDRHYEGGMTLEIWVFRKSGSTPSSDGMLASKQGSFVFRIKDNKLNNDRMVFRTVPVATTSLFQYKYYPVGGETFFGATPIPTDRWVHLAVTYDQRMKVIRTWIDGGIDRTRYLAWDGEENLQNDPTKPFVFLRGMKNVRVARIRLSKGVRDIGPVPAFEAYVHQLPYEGKTAVILDHIRRELQLPVELQFVLESPNGATKLLKRESLDSFERRQVFLDTPTWKNALHTLIINAYAQNRRIFTRSVRVANPHPEKSVTIGKDGILSVNSRSLFPLLIYHVFPEDFATVAAMGFNVIIPRSPSLKYMSLAGGDAAANADVRTCLDQAVQAKVFLMVGGNTVFNNLGAIPVFKGHPALMGWMAFDEPWGSLEKVQESYNVVKLFDPDTPVYCVQNNITRFAETAEGADILACDPYPIPNVSLRYVADATKAAVRAVAGLKPVWTILDQYEEKRPSKKELRCMAYLALIAGARGIGVYAWDDRPGKKNGWYTKEHTSDLQNLNSMIAELRSLQDVLIQPNASDRPTFTKANPALHAAIKRVNGRSYLFLANDSRQQEAATLTLPGIMQTIGRPLTSATVSPGLQFDNGRTSVVLPPLFSGVFEIK